MSFLDLATLAMHRRNEMDVRICVLMTKCDEARMNIRKLEMQAQNLVQQLNCEPTQLKERFLNSMKLLDEYIYLITDFNLSVEKIAETAANQDVVPVHDSPNKVQQILTPTKAHLLDVLSEPLPSTSTLSVHHKPVSKKPKKKKPTQEELLIEFSSNSCSQESVSYTNRQKVDKAPQIQLPTEDMCNLTLQERDEPKTWNLPAQDILQTDTIYQGFIIHIDGASLWMITEDIKLTCELMQDICAYYKTHLVVMTHERLMSLTYCAYYDHDTDCWYRCLLLKLDKAQGQKELVDVFLVDTGEMRQASPEYIQPLARQFCTQPPLARCCHLAGVDLFSNCNPELLERRDRFLKTFIGDHCSFEVDDNTSESLGVYVLLSSKKILNNLLVEEGLADMDTSNLPLSQSVAAAPPTHGPPEMRQSVENLDVIDITDCPEYEDPLEAVTGYHNRDEMDICKHYKGGPTKTCFKGDRCKKRHVMKHPDGWTLDRVEATAKCITLPLPQPATWHRVIVTHVCHFDYIFVQYVTEAKEEEHRRSFGTVLPPMTLASLIQDMNSPAGRAALQPLKLAPAPGEIVAALYPPDGQWYRAMVISLTNHDQSVEVRYLDFGSDMWVKENNVRQLDPAHTLLPVQAVKCRLAGVSSRSDDVEEWVKAKKRLQQLTTDRDLEMHVVSRGYDELEVELYNSEGSVAEVMAKEKLVALADITVRDDAHCTQRLVVP